MISSLAIKYYITYSGSLLILTDRALKLAQIASQHNAFPEGRRRNLLKEYMWKNLPPKICEQELARI